MADYVTVADCAERFGYSRQTVLRWIKDGLLPAARPPGASNHRAYRIREEDLAEFMAGGRLREASVLLAEWPSRSMDGSLKRLYHEGDRFRLRSFFPRGEGEPLRENITQGQYLKAEVARELYEAAPEQRRAFPPDARGGQ
jgi:excisionase family DNA binding protein